MFNAKVRPISQHSWNRYGSYVRASRQSLHIMAGEPGNVEVEHDWDKVIVIFPESYSRAYEVRSTRVVSPSLPPAEGNG